MTSENTFTPGPWKYAGWDSVKCDVYQDSTAPHGRAKIADVIREADAVLIAASPDLLVACQEALATCESDMQYVLDNGRLRDVLRAAIAKAVFRPTG